MNGELNFKTKFEVNRPTGDCPFTKFTGAPLDAGRKKTWKRKDRKSGEKKKRAGNGKVKSSPRLWKHCFDHPKDAVWNYCRK